MFKEIVDWLVWFVWDLGIPVGDGSIPWVVVLLLGTGVFLTIRLGFIQFRRLAHGFAVTSGKYDDPDEPGDVPHFQALTTALSATVGIGNIAGVALAIHFGGPGALFWMWVTALLGMATKYTEVTLAQRYRQTEAPGNALLGTVSGGPMYYIDKGLGWKPMAGFFAIMLMMTSFLTGNAVQANTVSDVLLGDFGIPVWTTGLVVASIIGLVVIGGIRRIGKVTGIVAPVMAAIYVLGALGILAFNLPQVPAAFMTVLTEAFNPTSGVAGTGAGVFLLTMIYGVQRGLFSNEAGQGSAPIAHSAAKTDEPVSEGVVALLEPFIDTIVICTLTGLAIIVTGVWDDTVPTQLDLDGNAVSYRVEESGQILSSNTVPAQITIENGVPQVEADAVQFAWNEAVVDTFYTACPGGCTSKANFQNLFTGTLYPDRGVAVAADGTTLETLYGPAVETGAPLTQLAFERGLAPLGDWGDMIVLLSVLLFAISTAISWSYYGDRCANYLFGKQAIVPYKIVFVIMNFVGAVTALTTIWTLGDIALGLVVLPNLIALVALSGEVREMTTSYFKRMPWIENEKVADRVREEKRQKDKEA
ncbi:alanine/glycine:cation symporter family protein [Salisaeta longa]|uniref:alanine/glycine:cation symporter family protein n=1 Tax=Salisaeta longa TaxID=503170 RepID=UPI0003B6FDF9|nr:sodium:alanine symporter family protein [Salisaeta longa]